MQFGCPSCAATISANFPKPGRFAPKCPKCGAPFVVQIRVSLEPAPVGAKDSGPMPAPAPRRMEPADAEATLASAVDSASAETPLAGTFVASAKPDTDPEGTFASGSAEPPEQDFDRTSAVDQPAADDATEMDRTGDYSPAAAPKKSNARDPDMPSELGGYEILKMLGQGGMGAVYLARQMSLDRAVALKVMNAQWANDPVFIARFVREAYASAQLSHHNVVQIYDIG